MNRKGVFFSVVAILLAGLTIASFLAYNNYKYTDQMSIIKVRVSSMDDFLSNVEGDLSRALYISSFRGLISLNDYITNINKSKGKLLDNVSADFIQIVTNGTIGNDSQIEILMVNQTIYDWIVKIQDIGEEIGLNTNITLNTIEISHSGPWTIRIDANFSLFLDDKKGLASWESEIVNFAEVPITDFRDPLYANRTQGAFRKIIRSNVTSAEWNLTKLLKFYETGRYIQEDGAPTFLMRMENDIGNGGSNGIMTIIDCENDLAPAINRSKVDFVYWRGIVTNTSDITGITETYEYFSLDPDHVIFFNVSDYT